MTTRPPETPRRYRGKVLLELLSVVIMCVVLQIGPR